MVKRAMIMAVVLAQIIGTARAQDADTVLQAAARTMGVDKMRSIQYSGSGWVGAVGQNFTPDLDWPRFDLTSYTRTEADLYTPAAASVTPPPPNASNRTLYENIQRLGLDVETIVPVHGRPGPISQFVRYVEDN